MKVVQCVQCALCKRTKCKLCSDSNSRNECAPKLRYVLRLSLIECARSSEKYLHVHLHFDIAVIPNEQSKLAIWKENRQFFGHFVRRSHISHTKARIACKWASSLPIQVYAQRCVACAHILSVDQLTHKEFSSHVYGAADILVAVYSNPFRLYTTGAL